MGGAKSIVAAYETTWTVACGGALGLAAFIGRIASEEENYKNEFA
jgi:hypothetical protein